jgi:hypothetical protein
VPDQVGLLAQLLGSSRLRRLLAVDPPMLSRVLSASAEESAWLAGLDLAQLESQADTLIAKRLSEVAALLPLTMAALGSQAAELFTQHAGESWPDGHRRHLRDAAWFAVYLRSHGYDSAVSSDEVRRVELRLRRAGRGAR